MSTENHVVTEAEILERVVMSDQPGMSPESARALLDLRFDSCAINRMQELAEKNRAGALTKDERQEMETYARVGNLLNIVQAKARLALSSGT
jgi:hypothetical protein